MVLKKKTIFAPRPKFADHGLLEEVDVDQTFYWIGRFENGKSEWRLDFIIRCVVAIGMLNRFQSGLMIFLYLSFSNRKKWACCPSDPIMDSSDEIKEDILINWNKWGRSNLMKKHVSTMVYSENTSWKKHKWKTGHRKDQF